MKFRELVDVIHEVEALKGRNDKVRKLAELFSRLDPVEAAIVARMITGRVFPEYSEVAIGVGWATIRDALNMVDSSLTLFTFSGPVTVGEVVETLERISRTRSRQKKVSYLFSLFSRLSHEEREYLLRILFGEVRIGASTGLVLEAIAKAAGCKIDVVRRAYMYLSDVGDVAEVALKEGCEGLRRVRIQLFRPVKPMLAAMAYSLREILQEHSGRTALEYKYDGVRVQIHKKDENVKVFSRRLSDLTNYVPEAVDLAKQLPLREAILDGEAVGVEAGRPIAFQEISRRIRRKREKERFLVRIPLHVYIFDILYKNGEDLTLKPYSERRHILESVVPSENLARMRIVENVVDAENFYQRAVEEGHEGVVAKRLNGLYEPGIRGKLWLKMKASDTIDCVIVAAEWGHGRRSRWLSDYHLAVYDDVNDRFLRVGKTYKGLTDAEFEEMTKRLLELKIAEKGYVVYVKPQIVVEVEYAEIQRSPRYESGYALRFARIKKIRWDKRPEEATTLRELEERYRKQRKIDTR